MQPHTRYNTYFLQSNLSKAVIAGKCRGRRLFLTPSLVSANKIESCLSALGQNVVVVDDSQIVSASDLHKLYFCDDVIAIAAGEGIKAKIAKDDGKYFFDIKKNKKSDIEELVKKLVEGGFSYDIYEKNSFSKKGDVIDIHLHEGLFRVCFFGKNVENIFLLNEISFARIKETESLQFFAPKNFGVKEGEIDLIDLNFDTVFVDGANKIEVDKKVFANKKQIVAFDNILSSNKYWNEGEYVTVQEQVLPSFYDLTQTANAANDFEGSDITLFVKNEYVKNQVAPLVKKNINILYGDFGGGIKLAKPFLSAVFNLRLGVSVQNDYKAKETSSQIIASFIPKDGDFVVHSLHGIGLCHGLKKREIDGQQKDFFEIEYAQGALLLVPVENADDISKFAGSGEGNPKLNIIGGADFDKTKQKAKKALKEVAFDLAKMFKERSLKKGFVFAQDCDLQKEFEAAFEHQETQGQLSAIAEIKNDMQSSKIMDRLLCADVGFGKTEVALRACFKAILSGKQVMFLAPTTVLSFQHYKSAKQRFSNFPVNVALLNRLVDKKEQTQIKKDLADGKINLIFGTHALLNSDIKFFDLGLLVIDEEQRFGTSQKEKLRNAKKDVDALMLSATPIPRSLHLSLINVRDISVIETPPIGRSAVSVFVAEYDKELIRQALLKELERGGQSFVVFNNVERIYSFAQDIKKMLPDETVVDVLHAQMPPAMLSKKIEDLYMGKTSVLVCTTVVENGLDIENANTIIVTGAEKFGLSDLYQLKGRVGRRANKQGHAYFLHNTSVLTETSEKRLGAILDFSNLGDGFEIALKDLQIRGSGNIFGAKQSGHLNNIGYIEFSKIVKEVVDEALGQKTGGKNDILVQIKLDGIVPVSFEPEESKRITLYKFLQTIDTQDFLDKALDKLTNQYGTLPQEIINLAYIILLKNKARAKGVSKIIINKTQAELVYTKKDFVLTKEQTRKISEHNAILKLDNEPAICFPPEVDVLLVVKELINFCD